ncbi:MAG TPA: DUF3891 family protein [Candidatus Acidoferrum sp.]|nr:DUF3891 family protein [Candidatus Acidoferrum sp.]
MILVEEKGERDPQLLVIRQTDHAFLAGFLAREWGNEKFTKPQPNASFCLAVAEHDNGWSEWELEAALDAKTRLPFSFMSIPTATHIALYQKGIERVVKVDHYAGLLASMHASVLYDRTRATMPGFSAKYVKNEESHIANEFVQQLRLQQLRLKVDLRGNAATKPFMEEPLIHANVARLEALDRLSLHFCLNPEEDAIVDAVPVNDQGEETDLELHGEGASVVTIAPYPFRREPLAFSIMARRVPKRFYASDGDFQKTLAAAQYSPVKFTMRARRSDAFSRVAGS